MYSSYDVNYENNFIWNNDIIDDDCTDDEILLTKGAENLLYLRHAYKYKEKNKKSNKHEKSEKKTTTSHNMTQNICQYCNTQTSPLWRKYKEWHTLCNACGIRLKTKDRRSNKTREPRETRETRETREPSEISELSDMI